MNAGVEMLPGGAAFVTLNGVRAFETSPSRAVGIAAALRSVEGRRVFFEARQAWLRGDPLERILPPT